MQSDLMLIHSRRVGSRRGNLIRKSACESSQSAETQRGRGKNRFMGESTVLPLHEDAK